MADISEISGITGSLLQLLREAGVLTSEALATRTPREILEALAAANSGKEIPVRLPSEATVQAWQSAAQGLGRGLASRVAAVEGHPAATKVRSADLMAAGIEVESIPVAKVVDDSGPGPKLERARRAPEGATPPAPAAPRGRVGAARKINLKRAAPAPAPAPAADPEKTTEQAGPGKPAERREAVQPARAEAPVSPGQIPPRKTTGRPSRTESNGQGAITADAATHRKPFRSLDEAQKATPPEKRRNRGMSHPEARRVWLAATVTILALTASTLTALALIGAFLMVQIQDWELHWTISLLLLVFPASLFAYLGIGTKVRCRLCGQRLFVPRHCLKHEQARRSIFGHTFAVARDAMFLGGYRCMLCGTKTRLKD